MPDFDTRWEEAAAELDREKEAKMSDGELYDYYVASGVPGEQAEELVALRHE